MFHLPSYKQCSYGFNSDCYWNQGEADACWGDVELVDHNYSESNGSTDPTFACQGHYRYAGSPFTTKSYYEVSDKPCDRGAIPVEDQR